MRFSKTFRKLLCVRPQSTAQHLDALFGLSALSAGHACPFEIGVELIGDGVPVCRHVSRDVEADKSGAVYGGVEEVDELVSWEVWMVGAVWIVVFVRLHGWGWSFAE